MYYFDKDRAEIRDFETTLNTKIDSKVLRLDWEVI